jgi:dsRNA-specific ribonuclease
MEYPDVTKSTLDSYIAKHSNAEDCAKDAVKLGLNSLIMVGKGVEMINNKILSIAFNAIIGAIMVDGGPTTANFTYILDTEEVEGSPCRCHLIAW